MVDLEWHNLLQSLIWDESMWIVFLYSNTKPRQASLTIFRKLSWKSLTKSPQNLASLILLKQKQTNKHEITCL